MALYRCDSCNADRDDAVCWNCGRDTREIDPSAAAMAPQPEVVDAPFITEVTPPRPQPAPPQPAPPLPPSEPIRFVPAPDAAPAPEAREIRGLAEFHALLDRGMESVIVCGGSKAGKSEIAAGFTRANNVFRGKAMFNTLRTTVQTGYVLGGTVAGEVWYQIIDEKRLFLDPSGEFFNLLSAEYRQRFGLPDITNEDFQFVQRAASRLAGIVLVVDLTRAVDERDFRAWRQQENDLNFVLAALRWLRGDKQARPEAISTRANIAQRANAVPMLDRPVLVLFSKADQLTTYVNHSPLELAKRRLPILHGSLMTHARRFRYDFCHTMTRTAEGDREVDNPCGVLLPLEWMLHSPFRWLPLQMPTRYLGGGK